MNKIETWTKTTTPETTTHDPELPHHPPTPALTMEVKGGRWMVDSACIRDRWISLMAIRSFTLLKLVLLASDSRPPPFGCPAGDGECKSPHTEICRCFAPYLCPRNEGIMTKRLSPRITPPARRLTLGPVALALDVHQVVEDVVQLLLVVAARQALGLEEGGRPGLADGRRQRTAQVLQAWGR